MPHTRKPTKGAPTKPSTIYTPPSISEYLFDRLSDRIYQTVLDPAVGQGSLTAPWRESDRIIIGCDTNPASSIHTDHFIEGAFEQLKEWSGPIPDLIIMNPPFNGAKSRKLYPELFLRKTVELFGNTIPTVMVAPMGLRLNQRKRSDRWQWLRDFGPDLTSILALPLDLFTKPDGGEVKFQTEVLFYNITGLEPHVFLPEEYLLPLLPGTVTVVPKSKTYYLTGQNVPKNSRDATQMTEACAIRSGYRYAHRKR